MAKPSRRCEGRTDYVVRARRSFECTRCDAYGLVARRRQSGEVRVIGRVAGHAGLFGSAGGVGAFARVMLRALAHDTSLAPFTTDLVTLAATKSAVPNSSRALGWDTMLTTSSCGTLMSPRAFGHVGFTGTSLWIDPVQDLYVVILSNRVHATREGKGIQEVRRTLHDAVIASLRAGEAAQE